jgi:hypothetical protein
MVGDGVCDVERPLGAEDMALEDGSFELYSNDQHTVMVGERDERVDCIIKVDRRFLGEKDLERMHAVGN